LSRPLRIAVIAACPFPLARGTPVRILRLSEALADRGHDVHVFAYHLGAGAMSPALTLHRIRAVPSYTRLSPGPSLVKLIRLDPMLASLTRRAHAAQPFDVIHAHHYEGLIVGAAARVGRHIPLVYDAHTLLMNELPSYPLGLSMPIKRAISRGLDRLLPAMADHTVCVSQKIRDTLVNDLGMRAADVSVMANGVEFEHFDPTPYPQPALTGPRTVIFTGNLASYQGVDYLLKAFALVAPRVPDARLVIGADSGFGAYETLAGTLGIRARIDILPAPTFDDLPRILAGAQVAVNPRVDCDGVPVKLLNYMASGRAVVSFDGSAPGVTHMENGWLARSADIASMAEGITNLLGDPELCRKLGAAARDYVAANSRWANVAERSEALYHQLLSSSPRR
jgi:glycosyltransferase involved in cell wall biosynthesis